MSFAVKRVAISVVLLFATSVLIFAVLLWLIGFFVGGVADGGQRRWYGR